MKSRKSSFILLGLLAVILSLAPLRAQSTLRAEGFLFDAFVPLDPVSVEVIESMQAWIAARQRPDGSFPTRHGDNNTGEISIALLALMVGGDVPGEGKYAEEIGRGIQYLLNVQQPSGLIASPDNTNHALMYQHALSVVFLSEAYGMTANPRIRSALIQGVNLIVRTQHHEGGWRYRPQVERGDVSATVMQVMALKGAAEAGIYVPRETVENVTNYIRITHKESDGGWMYQTTNRRHRAPTSFPRTAAGVVSLQSLGYHEDPMVHRGVEYIMNATADNDLGRAQHFWYGHYYTSIAVYHYGGEPWQNYYPRIRDHIVSLWRREQRFGGILDASWATLVLGVPYRYLPIYQR